MTGGRRVARVVVEVEPFHLDRPFDYLVPDDEALVPGQRVQVAFAGRSVRGLVVEVGEDSEVPLERLRPIRRVLGEHVWVTPDELEVLRWAATRYGAPLADVIRHALPARTVDVERRAAEAGWYPHGPGGASDAAASSPDPSLAASWEPYGTAGLALLGAAAAGRGSFLWRPLPGEDLGARLAELIRRCLDGGRDVLLVVPDPVSAAADAVVAAGGELAVDLRGGPSPRVAYQRWLRARCGHARVVVGERGAAFTPLARLGLAVVLDEANPALKERRSPRHHAREVVLERARRAGGVGLAVGTVPSALAWRLLRERRLTPVVPVRRAERDARPLVRVVDWSRQPRTRLSREAMAALRRAAAAGRYAVVLASRRGDGRALVCRACGDTVSCSRCGSSLARRERGVSCDGCGWQSSRTPRCRGCGGDDAVPLAAGTTRLAGELRRAIDAPVAVLEGYAAEPPPPPAVLVMTRGSALATPPGEVGAVVVPDLDGALRRPTLDAAEDALRLTMTLASWTVQHAGVSPNLAGAGEGPTERGAAPGNADGDAMDPTETRSSMAGVSGGPGAQREVVVQTREPTHHAVAALQSWDPGSFWRAEAPLRASLRFPPAAVAIRLAVAGDGRERHTELRGALPQDDDLLGPVATDGLATFLLKTSDRAATLDALRPLRERWSREGTEARLDVDPVDAL